MYLVDLCKKHRGCAELFQVQEESDEEAQMATPRSVRSTREAWAQSPSLLSHLSPPRSTMTVVRFDPSGKHVYVGTSIGSILVFNTRTKSVRLIPCRCCSHGLMAWRRWSHGTRSPALVSCGGSSLQSQAGP